MKWAALACLVSACAAQTAPTGSISGVVLDENHDPVSGAEVFLVEKRYDHGALQYPLAGGWARADDSGVYKLTGVPAGKSFLVETRVPRSTATGDLPANTLYPNVLSPDLAAEIVLRPGETRSGVDIHRAKLPTYCVEGMVDGAPDTGLNLETLDEMVVNSPQLTQRDALGSAKPDGTFRVCGIHPGEYLFMASGSSSDAGQLPFFASQTVAVTNGDVRDVKLPHSSMASFSAEFVWDGDIAAQVPSLHGVLDLEGRSAGFNVAFAVPSSVSHTLPLHPDNYRIDVLRGINGPGQYVKDITCGGRSVLHGTVALGGPTSCGALRFVIAHDGGSLTAHVADKDGNPISGAYVAIVPESAATEGEMSAAMTFGQTGPNGVYAAASLPPGKYRVLATNDAIDLAANRVDRLWAAQSRGLEVEIGANASVQLKLEPRPLQ